MAQDEEGSGCRALNERKCRHLAAALLQEGQGTREELLGEPCGDEGLPIGEEHEHASGNEARNEALAQEQDRCGRGKHGHECLTRHVPEAQSRREVRDDLRRRSRLDRRDRECTHETDQQDTEEIEKGGQRLEHHREAQKPSIPRTEETKSRPRSLPHRHL